MTTAQQQSTQNRTFPHDLCFFLFFVFVQKTKRAVRRPSSALGRTCASLSVGSVTGTKTVLTGPTRASKLAVVRLTGLIVHCCPSHWTHWLFRHNHLPFVPIQIHQLLVMTRCKGCWNGSFPWHSFQFSYHWPRLDSALVVPHKSWVSPQLLCSGQSKVAVTACPISGLLALLTWLDSDSIGTPVFCCFQLLCQILLALL